MSILKRKQFSKSSGFCYFTNCLMDKCIYQKLYSILYRTYWLWYVTIFTNSGRESHTNSSLCCYNNSSSVSGRRCAFLREKTSSWYSCHWVDNPWPNWVQVVPERRTNWRGNIHLCSYFLLLQGNRGMLWQLCL